MTTLDQLLYGVRQVESGGNYSVVNSIGAVGAYQVMKANIPSWTKRALGYSMTWQQFRNSRSAQDTVARVILGGYYKRYGAAGAASMWFSGQPNPNSGRSDGGNTVRQYVNKVLSASGGGSVSGGSSGGGGYTAAAPVKVKLSASELASSYGLTSALINSSKELKSLFNKAVSGQWSATRFQAGLKTTKWWKTQSSTLRQYVTQKFTDPATFKQKQTNAYAKFNSMAAQVGLGPQLKNGKASSLLQKVAYNSLALGWSDARIKDYLGNFVTTHDGMMWGEAGENFDKMHELAYLNGMKYGTDRYRKWTREIAAGRSTLQNTESYIRQQAAAKYSAFAEQIKAGQNAIDLAAPYIKSAATLLELPETEVDLNEKLVSNAMTGSHAGANFPLWEFENAVRNDPRWRKTNNARESMMTVARQVAKDFGMAY